MKRITRLTEGDLTRLVKKILNEGIRPNFVLDEWLTGDSIYWNDLKKSGYYQITATNDGIYLEPVTDDGVKKENVTGFYVTDPKDCNSLEPPDRGVNPDFKGEKMIPNPYLNNPNQSNMSLQKYIELYKNKPPRIYSLGKTGSVMDNITGKNAGYLLNYLVLKPKDKSSEIFIRTKCVSNRLDKQIQHNNFLKSSRENIDQALKYGQFN